VTDAKSGLGKMAKEGQLLSKPVIHKAQQCLVMNINGLERNELWRPRIVTVDGEDFAMGLISHASTMIEFNAHESLTEEETRRIISMVANPKQDPNIKIEVQRSKIIGSNEVATRTVAWLNSAKIPKSWILRKAALAL
jgi:hypothetical protein